MTTNCESCDLGYVDVDSSAIVDCQSNIFFKKFLHKSYITRHSSLERLLREKNFSTNFQNSKHENTILEMKDN